MSKPVTLNQRIEVNQAFSIQSLHYDADDRANRVLSDLRQQVYAHVKQFISVDASILELNAGTGIDAAHFVNQGYRVHATDLSDGMIKEIEKKISVLNSDKFTSQQLSYDRLDQVKGKFDYVFSNFGGLNCIQDLRDVTVHLPAILNRGAYITWVIMPPVCTWEIAGIFKGRISTSLRRFRKNGALSHLEGHYFQTYYHSLSSIKAAFGKSFQFVMSEGLAAISPMPHRGDFPESHPKVYNALRALDNKVRRRFPFNHWADHIIVTFRFTG